MVKIIKQWESVEFQVTKRGYLPETIYLTLCHKTKTYTICTEGEESVSFEGDCIAESKMKIEGLKAAIKYVEDVIKK